MQKIRWGVLGTAQIARNAVIPAIRASRNGEVVAIASRSIEKAREWAGKLGIPRAYGAYEELIADPNVDAVYNPLPVSLHAEWSLRCAQAGKPVLCEKPLTANAAEARRVTAAFAQRKVRVAEGLMYRYHPLTRKVKELVDGGAVGRLQLIRSSFTVNPPGADNIRFRKETGGGAMLDLGCYCVSLTRLIAGEEPDRVRAFGVFGKESGVDEWVVAILRFPSQALAYFGCSQRSQFDCSYDITGTTGRLLVDFGGMVVWPNAEFKIKHWAGEKYEELTIPPANHYLLMVEDFADALLRKRRPTYSIQDSVRNMRVIDRVLKAAAQ